MKTVLIFGCGGFVGKHLVREFAQHGYTVDGSDIVDTDNQQLALMRHYDKTDLLDPTAVEAVIQKSRPDYIINLAAISSVGLSWKIPQKTISVNVNGSLNILEAVRKAQISPKILLVGSSEEYSVSDGKLSEDYPINANNPYGISKVSQEFFAELYRREYGMKIINTRTFNHTGIGQPEAFAIPSFVRQVADIHISGKPGVISVGNLSANRDLGDVRDMASAYRMILESDTEEIVFNVGSGQCHSMEEILHYIISLTPQPIEIRIDPEKIRPIDNPVIWCDNSRLRDEIGWCPQFTIYDTINEMFQYMIKKD